LDPYGDARVGRRQVLRWGGGLALAAAVGCAPLRTGPPRRPGASPASPEQSAGEGAAPADPQAASSPSGEPRPDDPDAGGTGDPEAGGTGDPEAGGAGDPEAGGTGDPLADGTATVEVLCRDAVGLAAATAGGRPHRLRQLTVHHSALPLAANRRAPERLRRHQRFHLDQGWPDIAYHFAVDLRGNVYELRDPGLAGDTFTAYDPDGHLGVVCEGDFDQQHPTEAMLDGAALVLAHAATAYGLDPRSVSGHREHTLTRCPGDHLAARVVELREAVVELTAGTVQRRDLCGAAGRARIEVIARSG
jgi:hypothetical protein